MADRDSVPLVPLTGDVSIPQLGFGVFRVPPERTVEVTMNAFQVGYRHIDTAAGYGNESGVGEAVRRAGLDRDDVFITTKCFNDAHGFRPAKKALTASLGKLGLEYVDLYLIHWPVPARDLYVDTWRALIELRDAGLARSIGVSNFQPAHLDRLVAETGVTPSLNQVELHPLFTQLPLRIAHHDLGVVTEAWSPLARGQVLRHPEVEKIAAAYDRTPSQVVLRWHLEHGHVAIPKSDKLSRMQDNFHVLDFELASEDVRRLDALETGCRVGPDPDTLIDPRGGPTA